MKKIVVVFFLFVAIHNSKAQSLANYTSVRNTGATYASINAFGLAFSNWRNTTTFTQDDNRSDFTDIGFDFWYNGIRYTQFSASTNGFIDFSNSTDDGGPTADDFGYANTAFTSNNVANSTNPAIAPFYDDLTAQGGADPLGTSINYFVSGTAPNRTLTIEWINMAVYLNTTPSLNFQVQLIETSGRIKINYGTMTQGTQTFNYSMGLNANVINATPTAAQLKELQTVNSNVFSNTVQNGLVAMPAANSQYIFTPPVPANPSGSLTFSGVSQGGMTLNWTNWATNEVGYVIYNSTDGVNFNFVTQTAANAVTNAVAGLLPSTTYYWRLYAVTEGCLSGVLTGTQTTAAGGNKISRVTGNWSTATTWSPTGVPTSGDNVTIANGHTVSINVNGQCNSLIVGQGGAATLQYNGATARVLTISNNLTVSTGATFNVNTGSNVTHTVNLLGNVTNNGTLNFATDGNSLCNARFIKTTGNQTVTGTGATTNFNTITCNVGSSLTNLLDISSSNFTAPANFLTLTSGTFKLSTANASNITPFTAAGSILQNQGIWLNSTNSIINFGAGVTLTGKITVSNGTMNIGNAANEDLLSSGGSFSVTGGVTNIAGKYYSTGINNLTYFAISNGTVNVPTFGSTDATNAPFQITGAGSSFNMTGGLIVIPREGGTGAQNLGYINTGSSIGSVTGGTLQIGNATTPAAQIISVNSNYAIGNLNVRSANATASITTNALNVFRNVLISSGTLNAGNLNITLGGNWTNNTGTYTPGTNTTIFNSTIAQSIFKTGGEIFNNLTFSGAGVKTFSSAVTASNVSINGGSTIDVNSPSHQLTIRGNYTNSGTVNTRTGTILFNGTVAQTIGGTSITNFHNLTINKASGGISLLSAQNLINTLNLNNGVFSTNSQAFTMVSTATMTARIAQITGTGDITGNVIVQRFAPGGFTGWALLGTPLSSALTLNDWDDDIVISCPTCPDGYAAGFPSIYTYDETQPGLYDAVNSYSALNTINDPIIPNKGYWVYLGTGPVSTSNITLDVTGSVRKFNTSIPLTRTNTGSIPDDGWNLIHNPYPSPIRWSLLRGATANLDNAIYVYNADLNAGAGAYATYVNNISSPSISAGGVGDTIPMSQAFYVHSTGATVLNAQESHKTGGQPTFLKMIPSAPTVASSMPLLRLNLKNAAGYDDETVLYYESGATDFFDEGYDAYKMRGQDPNAPIIALEKTVEFQVNGINPISGNFTMPLKTTTGYPGTYTITANNISSFPAGACITLYDKLLGITTDLKTSNYVFNLSSTTTTARFDLNISVNPLNINSTTNQPVCAQPNSGEITAVGANAGPWNYYWKNSVGATIKTSLAKTTADTLNNLSGSTYTVEVNTVGMCDNNTTAFVINPVTIPTAAFTSEDTTDLSLGALVNFTNTSTNSSSDFWDFGDGVGFSTATSPNYNYTSIGNFTATLISTSSTGCNDTTTKTIVVINSISTGIESYENSTVLLVRTINENNYLIQQKLNSETDLNFKLTDAIGRLLTNYGDTKSDKINLSVDLRNYPQGIYFLTILANDKPITIKLPVK
jgi:hypothetical protein